MNKTFKILTIFGSPNDNMSNTRGFIEGFLDMVEDEGLPVERQFLSLGRSPVSPCRGCWACTQGKSCPIKDDSLPEIKSAMLNCDMLILASPVYTNQVSAQMKAFLDRLFTWCHIFPLLGKYSLSVATTGNDGHRETADYLEKMLATYGTLSFGPVTVTGSFTPGFFPRRESELARYTQLARRIARTVSEGRHPRPTAWNRKMFKAMKRKIGGIHAVNFILKGPVEGQPDPPKVLVGLIRRMQKKAGTSRDQIEKLTRYATFEYEWWKARGWLKAGSFRELAAMPVPQGFEPEKRLA